MSKKPESIGGLVDKIARPPIVVHLREQDERIAELEGALRAILACDYRGPKPPSYRIAEEALGVEP